MQTNPVFPNAIWDGNTKNPWRDRLDQYLSPNPDDWSRIVAELIATQQQVKILMEAGSGNPNFNVKVGWFPCPESIGIHQITDVGFKPKRVAFYVCKTPGLRISYSYCHGMADHFGNQNSQSWSSSGRRSESRGDSRTDLTVYLVNNVHRVDQVLVAAYCVSMDDDGFTLEFLNVWTDYIIRWEAIG